MQECTHRRDFQKVRVRNGDNRLNHRKMSMSIEGGQVCAANGSAHADCPKNSFD
jgi:hypothetical protein